MPPGHLPQAPYKRKTQKERKGSPRHLKGEGVVFFPLCVFPRNWAVLVVYGGLIISVLVVLKEGGKKRREQGGGRVGGFYIGVDYVSDGGGSGSICVVVICKSIWANVLPGVACHAWA